MASATLEEKINKIRQKNEEIRRRHEEVEADKQNAAKLNALVKMVPPTDWPERKEPPEFSNPPPPKSNGNSKPKVSTREYRGQQQQYHAGGSDGKKTHVFAEGDGPPPDPTYNFLADSEREERTKEDVRENEKSRGRGGPLRGSSRKRGGVREGYSKEYRGFPAQKDASKPEYDAWRAERNRIDEARINRQRTAEGNWRREWDNNKINVEEDKTGLTKLVRQDVGDVRKDYKEFDKWQAHGNDHESPRGRGGKQYASRAAPRGSHNNRVYHHSNSFEQSYGPMSPSVIKSPPSPNGIDERTVVATDKSIKVIVNHGTTVPKGPVMSVKVSSSSIAGTGRVGPRQKPRTLYSSQSETEVLGHEHEKFSSHKSPDDKTNHVSFNRDIDEQRYAPKSPHPQRKGESNSKSPYLNRKEFKYDSQQQKYGENDPKSPYLQRTEIKDCPKSPHFQRRVDFTNRDSHIKQKNHNPITDSFKSNYPPKRMSEKTKHDSQKFTGPRKFDDTTAPKPQRTNKRTEKSKNSQRTNSKEEEESCTNENETQENNFGTSAKNVTRNNESPNKDSHVNNNNSKTDSSQDPLEVKTTNANEEKDNNVSKLNSISETLSPSADLELDGSSDDKKLIYECEPKIPTFEETIACPESINASNNGTEEGISAQNIEPSTATESGTSYSGKSKKNEGSENVEDIESSEKVKSEINTAVQGKVKTTIESNIYNDKDKIESIKDTSNVELDHEQNSIVPVESTNLEKLEQKEVIAKSELQSAEKDEISVKPEKIANETQEPKNVVESTSVAEKIDLSDRTETHQSSEEQVSNSIDEKIGENLEDGEN